MHGYYIYYRDIYSPTAKLTGIDRKVIAQIKTLNEAGFACEYLLCRQPESTAGKVASCLPFLSDGIAYPNPDTLSHPDFLYIRRPRFMSRQFLAFLTRFRARFPHATLLYEVPTYPYDAEYETPTLYPALRKDRRWRRELAPLVDRVVEPLGVPEVFGIPALHFTNGIDLQLVTQRRPAPYTGVPEALCAAQFCEWHGIDRLLAGMRNYRAAHGTGGIRLHLIGEGPSNPKLIALTKRYHLEDDVTFHGFLTQREMDPLYDRCNLGIESLGIHRRDNKVSTSLKSKEYLAKGIPFICSGPLDVFPHELPDYCLSVPADDSPVDIAAVRGFVDALYARETPQDVSNRIRAFAEGHIGWDKGLKSVLTYLGEVRAARSGSTSARAHA